VLKGLQVVRVSLALKGRRELRVLKVQPELKVVRGLKVHKV
jgi:hypothetical protein